MSAKLWDVVAVNVDSRAVRMIAKGKTENEAGAIVMMAVARRGVENEFFAEVESGMYSTGDRWEPQ